MGDLPDYLGDRATHVEQWDDGTYRAERLAGALLETFCTTCTLTVSAAVIDGPDPVFADVECPVCHTRWTERVS